MASPKAELSFEVRDNLLIRSVCEGWEGVSVPLKGLPVCGYTRVLSKGSTSPPPCLRNLFCLSGMRLGTSTLQLGKVIADHPKHCMVGYTAQLQGQFVKQM